MVVKLSYLFLLLVLLHLSWTKKQNCSTFDSSCNQCIQSGPECAWCTSPNTNIRCHTVMGLQRAGCHKSHIYKPQGSVQVVKNDSRMDPADGKTVFLQPQEILLHLRPGVSQSFPLTISMPTDHPITELTMDTSNVPAGLNITFSSLTTGNPLLIQVNVEAAQCPSKNDQNNTAPWSVQITPRGFGLSVNLEIILQCQCNCTGNREENSPACSGHGALICGRCECYQHHVGKHCQSDIISFESENEESCRSGSSAPVCSGRGVCVMGRCHCNKRENPKEIYSGKFCQCSNFDCPYHKKRICGGNGKCECGKCICDVNWTGDACSCNMDPTPCLAKTQQLCNGRGMCECGACRCIPPYTGPICEDCPVCPNRCVEHAACVECRAFGTGAKMNTCDRECGYLNVMMVETKDEVPRETGGICNMRDHEDCFFYYTFSSAPSGGQSIVARTKECRRVTSLNPWFT